MLGRRAFNRHGPHLARADRPLLRPAYGRDQRASHHGKKEDRDVLHRRVGAAKFDGLRLVEESTSYLEHVKFYCLTSVNERVNGRVQNDRAQDESVHENRA